MAKINHVVWPTRAPGGPTAFWDQEAWDRWAEGYRPPGYTGDAHDVEAWNDFQQARAWAACRAQFPGYYAGVSFWADVNDTPLRLPADHPWYRATFVPPTGGLAAGLRFDEA